MKLKILNCIILAGGPSDSAPAQLSQVWSDHSTQASVSCCCCCCCEFILHDVPKVNLSDVHCNSWMAWDLMGIWSNWSRYCNVPRARFTCHSMWACFWGYKSRKMSLSFYFGSGRQISMFLFQNMLLILEFASGILLWLPDNLDNINKLTQLGDETINHSPTDCKEKLSHLKQARKARRCVSFLQIWNYQWPTDKGRC